MEPSTKHKIIPFLKTLLNATLILGLAATVYAVAIIAVIDGWFWSGLSWLLFITPIVSAIYFIWWVTPSSSTKDNISTVIKHEPISFNRLSLEPNKPDKIFRHNRWIDG